MVIHVEGTVACVSTYREDASGSHVRKSIVSRLDEITEDVRIFLFNESQRP